MSGYAIKMGLHQFAKTYVYALKDLVCFKFFVVRDAWDVGGQINVRNINWKDSCSSVVQLQKKQGRDWML